MGLRLKRVGDEFRSWREALVDWYDEMVVENGPRYRSPGQWIHLYVDIFGATIQLAGRTLDRLHYTLSHLVGVGLPLWGLWELFHG